jgi:hypothetical protein
MLVLVMLSQTTAHNRASIAPSIAIVNAAGSTKKNKSRLKLIKLNEGHSLGKTPIVGTFNFNKNTAKQEKTKAIIEGGIFFRYLDLDKNFGKKSRMLIVNKAIKIEE